MSPNSQSDTLNRRYTGPRPFDDNEVGHHTFQGREKQTSELLHRIDIESGRFLVLTGESGTGKSSLLNARLFPQLRENDYFPIMVRGFPDRQPLVKRVRDAIAKSTESQGLVYESRPPKESLEMGHLWEFFKTAAMYYRRRKVTPVLVLDQFEELFTLQDRDPEFRRQVVLDLWELASGLMPERLRGHGQGTVSSALTAEHPDVRVLVSMRIDYVGRLAEFRSFFPTIIDNTYSIQGLSVEDARSAIVEPARLEDGPLKFASAPFEFPPTTVEQILKSAKRDTDNSIEPIILQVFCHNIEEQHLKGAAEEGFSLPSDAQAVDAAKNLALGEYYEREVTAAALEGGVREELIREWFEAELMDPTGQIRIQCAATEELLAKSGMSTKAVQRLEKGFLIRREVRHGAQYYELVHDQLVKPICKANENWGLKQAGIGGRAIRWDRTRNEKELLPKAEIERIKQLFSWPDPSDARPPGVPMTLLERRLVYSSIAAAERESEKLRLEAQAIRLDSEKREAELERAKAKKAEANAKISELKTLRIAQLFALCMIISLLTAIGAFWFWNTAERASQKAGLVGYTQSMRRSREQYKGLSVSEAFEAFNSARSYLEHPGFVVHPPRIAPVEWGLVAAAYRQEEWKRWPPTDWPDQSGADGSGAASSPIFNARPQQKPVIVTEPVNNVAISPTGRQVVLSVNTLELAQDRLIVGDMPLFEDVAKEGSESMERWMSSMFSLSRIPWDEGGNIRNTWSVPFGGLAWSSENSVVCCVRFETGDMKGHSRLIEWTWSDGDWHAKEFPCPDEQSRIVCLRALVREGVVVTLDESTHEQARPSDRVRLWRKQDGEWVLCGSQLVDDQSIDSLEAGTSNTSSNRLLAVAALPGGEILVAATGSSAHESQIGIWRCIHDNFEMWGTRTSKYAIKALELAAREDNVLLGWCDDDGRLWEVGINGIVRDNKDRFGKQVRIGRSRKRVWQIKSAEVEKEEVDEQGPKDGSKTRSVWIASAQDGAVRLWDGRGSRLIFAAQNPVMALDVRSVDRQIQLAMGDSQRVVARTISDKIDVPRRNESSQWYSAQLTRDGRYSIGGNGRRFILTEMKPNAEQRRAEIADTRDLTTEGSEIWSTAIGGPNDQYLACGTSSGEIFVWKRNGLSATRISETPHMANGSDGQMHAVTALAIHPRSNMLVYSTRDGGLRCWQLRGIEPPPLLPIVIRTAGITEKGLDTSVTHPAFRYGIHFERAPSEETAIHSIAFDQSGDWLITGDKAGRILLWPWRNDATLGLPEWVGDHDGDAVQSVAIFQDDVNREQLILSGGNDGQIRIWRFPTTEFPSADPKFPTWDTEQVRPYKAPLAEFHINQFPGTQSAGVDEPSHQIGLTSPEPIIGVCITPVRIAQTSKTDPGRPVVDLLAISGRNGEVHRLTSTPLNPRFNKRDGR